MWYNGSSLSQATSVVPQLAIYWLLYTQLAIYWLLYTQFYYRSCRKEVGIYRSNSKICSDLAIHHQNGVLLAVLVDLLVVGGHQAMVVADLLVVGCHQAMVVADLSGHQAPGHHSWALLVLTYMLLHYPRRVT